jgi:hypothetical protein
MTGDSIQTGNIQGVGVAVGTGASVSIYGDIHFDRPVGIPFQAPPLPTSFVPRTEVSSSLKDRLLATSPATPGVLVVKLCSLSYTKTCAIKQPTDFSRLVWLTMLLGKG